MRAKKYYFSSKSKVGDLTTCNYLRISRWNILIKSEQSSLYKNIGLSFVVSGYVSAFCSRVICCVSKQFSNNSSCWLALMSVWTAISSWSLAYLKQKSADESQPNLENIKTLKSQKWTCRHISLEFAKSYIWLNKHIFKTCEMTLIPTCWRVGG